MNNLDYLGFIFTPALTAGFFLLALNKSQNKINHLQGNLIRKQELFYNWYPTFFRNILIGYISWCLLLGLLVYFAYYFGIKLTFDHDPNVLVAKYVTKKTPLPITIFVQSFVISSFIFGFCNSKPLPIVSGTVHDSLLNTFFRDFYADLIEDRRKGTLIMARRIIKKYNKALTPILTKETFGVKIATYISENKHLMKADEYKTFEGLIKDMEKATTLDRMVYYSLIYFTAKKVKSILDI